MTDHATPNLPSADLDRTAAFYAHLGFETGFKDAGWMILSRGGLIVEFVPMDTDPLTSNASCCFRVDDLDALYARFAEAGLSGDCRATPRLDPPRVEEHGLRMFALIDPDGNLVRCIQN